MFSILLNRNIDRDKVMRYLERKGIESRPFFYPIHKMPPYKRNELLPVAEEISSRGISLPSSIMLGKDSVRRICEVLREAIKLCRRQFP